MKISTKSLKAIKALLDVALLGAFKPIPLAVISRRRRISVSHLEEIFRQLRQHGLVRSIRGPGGGYRLGRSTAAISVADIVNAVDNEAHTREPTPVRGLGADDVAAVSEHLWRGLDEHLGNYLGTVTLATLIASVYGDRPRATIPAGTPATPQPGAPAPRAEAMAVL